VPIFENGPQAWNGQDWRLLQNGSVHLYWRPEVLAETVAWLRFHGYHMIELDTAAWRHAEDMHAGLSAALDFPDYYDHNQDALADCLGDVAGQRYGTDVAATGTVLVLWHYNGFSVTARREAQALLEAWARAARLGLLIGHRMLALVQSDTGRIRFDPVGAQPVAWNLAEWRQDQRTP
jgi:hypothetical protein